MAHRARLRPERSARLHGPGILAPAVALLAIAPGHGACAGESPEGAAETRAAAEPDAATAGPDAATTAAAADESWLPDDDDVLGDELADLDLADLMQIQVTSVAGVARSVLDTPSAITVLRADDLRRTGARSLAEALRLVPGYNVGRINSSMWSVGARGFGGRFNDSLLVMIDGRAVYDPLFSGVFWDVQDVMIEDLDRIEVIRGPGATLWGSNAVNGVVNVTTKSAKETQGVWLSGGAGNVDPTGFGEVRYGGTLGENGWFRIWSKYDGRGSFEDAAGDSMHDDWSMLQGGIRADWEGEDGIVVSAQARLYDGHDIGEETRVPVVAPIPTFRGDVDAGRASGGHAMFRIAKESGDSGWSLQTYYDRTERTGAADLRIHRDTADLEFRQWFQPAEGHDLIWGAGYRYTSDEVDPSAFVSYDPAHRATNLATAFIQDSFAIVPDRLHGMLGTKVEHNDYTGWEIQPSGRLWWTPNETTTVWGAVSRAVRVPSRTDHDIDFITAYADSGLIGGGPPSGMNVPLAITGDPDTTSEQMLSFEAGWRTTLAEGVTLDVATFYNDYEDLIGTAGGAVGPLTNSADGESYGGEASLTWLVADNWRLTGWYSYAKVNTRGPGATRHSGYPIQQAHLRSYYDLTDDIEINAAAYFVDGNPGVAAPAYIRFDLGLTWRPTANLEISIWGQNLFDDAHPESFDEYFQIRQAEVPRSFYVQASLRF